jgi:hypothetical protein
MPDTDPDRDFPEFPSTLPLETVTDVAVGPLRAESEPMGPRNSLWAALVGYFAPAEALRFPALGHEGIRRLDEEDFSAEHGYEPGFEGRSEFEHGEFERWI